MPSLQAGEPLKHELDLKLDLQGKRDYEKCCAMAGMSPLNSSTRRHGTLPARHVPCAAQHPRGLALSCPARPAMVASCVLNLLVLVCEGMHDSALSPSWGERCRGKMRPCVACRALRSPPLPPPLPPCPPFRPSLDRVLRGCLE